MALAGLLTGELWAYFPGDLEDFFGQLTKCSICVKRMKGRWLENRMIGATEISGPTPREQETTGVLRRFQGQRPVSRETTGVLRRFQGPTPREQETTGVLRRFQGQRPVSRKRRVCYADFRGQRPVSRETTGVLRRFQGPTPPTQGKCLTLTLKPRFWAMQFIQNQGRSPQISIAQPSSPHQGA